jgi:hypothetical protein
VQRSFRRGGLDLCVDFPAGLLVAVGEEGKVGERADAHRRETRRRRGRGEQAVELAHVDSRTVVTKVTLDEVAGSLLASSMS